MVMVEKKNDVSEQKILQTQQSSQQQSQQLNTTTDKRESYNELLSLENKNENYDDDSLDEQDEDYDENDDDNQHSPLKTNDKRPRSIEKYDKDDLSINSRVSKYGKIETISTLNQTGKNENTMKKDGNEYYDSMQKNHENLLLKKVYTKYTDEVQNSMYAPISPALTNNSDKSPLHHHDLMIMHHFNEDHGLSLSALSSSSSSLIRTSSNASSSSSTSSSNNMNNNESIMINNSNITNQNENNSFLMPTTNQLLMLNENLKKFISTSGVQNNESFLSDQLALMVRSRSSSSESSVSSAISNNNNNNYQNHQQMKNLFQMSSLNNLRNTTELDNANTALLSKYLNSVTRAFNNQKQQQQQAFLNNSNQDTAVTELLLKQAQMPSMMTNKLSKIDENSIDLNGVKPVAIQNSVNNSPGLNNNLSASVMKQMLSSYNSMANFNQQVSKIDQQDQESVLSEKISTTSTSSLNGILQTVSKAESDKNSIENVPNAVSNETDIKNEEIKAKLNAVVNKVGTNVLPSATTTCKVCGDEASGFHYGVDSCEGCKGFFRRCITQGMNHQCTNNQQCEITPFSRNSCQFCRLKKCFAVGMSREASRLGRRPKRPRDEGNSANQSWTKSMDEDNIENTKQSNEMVKESKEDSQQSRRNLGGFEQNQIENTNENSTGSINNQFISQKFKKENLNESPKAMKSLSKYKETPLKANSLMDLSSITSSLNSIPQPPFNLDNKTANEKIHQNNVADDEYIGEEEQPQQQQHYELKFHKQSSTSSLKHFEFNKIPNQAIDISTLLTLIEVADEYLSFERVTQLEYIRCTIIEAYCLLWPTTQEKIQTKMRENPPIIKPKTPHLMKESHLWDDSIEAIVPLIMDVVKCCKYIPGFGELTQNDQVQLLKQGSFEAICVNSFNLVDTERKLMLSFDLKYSMDSSDIKSIPLGFFMSDVFELSLKASSLKLNDEEIALFNALLIINPNREGLLDRKKVQELQATLLHVLYRHMKKFRPDDDEIFSKLLKLIPILSNLNKKHSETLNKLQTKTPVKDESKIGEANSSLN